MALFSLDLSLIIVLIWHMWITSFGFSSLLLFVTVTDTVEGCVDMCTVLDCIVHPMEYRLGSAHAHDSDAYLLGSDVRVESTKGLSFIILYILFA